MKDELRRSKRIEGPDKGRSKRGTLKRFFVKRLLKTQLLGTGFSFGTSAYCGVKRQYSKQTNNGKRIKQVWKQR